MVEFTRYFNPILAHGALGGYDEIIFISVAAVFLVMMGVSWFRSRNDAIFEDDTSCEAAPPEINPSTPANDAHFDLR